MLILEATKETSKLELFGAYGNIVAGFGAFIAAVASWWSIHTANKATKEARDQARPKLQFGRMDIILGIESRSASIKFNLLNIKQCKLRQIEYSTFILYPKDSENDTSDCIFQYMGGDTTRQFEIGSSLVSPLETKTKIVLMCKTTDVNGNTGMDTFTIRYVDRDYITTDTNFDSVFDYQAAMPVYTAVGTVGQEVIGFTCMLPYLHSSIIGRIVERLNGNHDGAIDEMLYEKTLKSALFKNKLRRWVSFKNLRTRYRDSISTTREKP